MYDVIKKYSNTFFFFLNEKYTKVLIFILFMLFILNTVSDFECLWLLESFKRIHGTSSGETFLKTDFLLDFL